MADYHSLLMRAVANLPNAGTPATRGAIYGRAKKALLEQLRSLRPPLPESDIEREEKALDKAIAEIEGRYGSEGAAGPSCAGRGGAAAFAGCGKAGRRACCRSTPPQPAPIQRPAAPAASGPSAGRSATAAQARPGQPESTPGAPTPPGRRPAASGDGSGAQPGGRAAAAPVAASADRACGEARRSRRRPRLRRLDRS